MEDCLAALRQEVDRLDDQIAELFLKRMEVTGRIGACKEELGLPLMDPRRELEVLRSAAAETLDEGRKLELAHLFETVLALSRGTCGAGWEGTIPVRDTADAGGPRPPRGSRWRDPGWSIRAWRGHTARWPPCVFLERTAGARACPPLKRCSGQWPRAGRTTAWCPSKTAPPGLSARCTSCWAGMSATSWGRIPSR